MGRPRTPVGTHGNINVVEIRKKSKGKPAVWEARTWFRARNGRLLRPRRRGPTEPAAVRNLKKVLARLVDEVRGTQVSPDSRFAHVAQLWLDDLERKVKRGLRAEKTLYDYRDTWRNHLEPRLGELTCREVEADVAACDEAIKAIQDDVQAGRARNQKRAKTGTAAAIRAKTVLKQICDFAVRNKAMVHNPVASIETVERDTKGPIRVLEPHERLDFLSKLADWAEKRVSDTSRGGGRKYNLGPRARAWKDLVDLAIGGLATGGRLGELLAVSGDEVDTTDRTVELAYHLVRVQGEGMVRKPGRKGKQPPLTVKIPTWSVPMFRRRKLESGGGPLFPTWNGGWEDPSNVSKRLRKACNAIGYDWVASHVFRRTVGTHLGDNDVVSTAIGDQLGNTAAMVERSYRRKRVANAAVAEVLETMLEEASG
ncbi:site-specific integrase [Amycolatopsis thermoflava]|uniref:site-specific integrase n=1 Tax=Amycolatopsis thermoflava TaxID=84480 RepID=UPI003F49F63C